MHAAEIGKGVLSELHEIRVVVADRTSAVHNHKDAARSLWVALQTQQLTSELIALKLASHPKLLLCSINHLSCCHRVLPKAVETMTAKVAKVENDLCSVMALQQRMKVKHPLL